MQVLNVTNLPIYLPYDEAHVPFGDPLEGVTMTAAAPGVLTTPGYEPTNGDQIALSYLAGGSMPAPLVVGQAYFAVASANDTCELAATKGGAAITTTTTGANLVAHLLSGQVDGVGLPFKPNNTAVCLNLSGGALVLQGAADSGQATPGQGYNPPSGPGAWQTIATVAAGSAALVTLNYDWIRVSTAGTLVLMQN